MLRSQLDGIYGGHRIEERESGCTTTTRYLDSLSAVTLEIYCWNNNTKKVDANVGCEIKLIYSLNDFKSMLSRESKVARGL